MKRPHIPPFTLLSTILLFFPFSLSFGLTLPANYPEGPLLHQGKLYFVEYTLHQITLYNKQEKSRSIFWQEMGCGPASLIPYQERGFLVACYDSHQLVLISPDGKNVLQRFPNIIGPNDFTTTSWGGIYFTASGRDFSLNAPIEGKVYYLPPEENALPILVADNIHYANGISLIKNEQYLLVAEHLQNRILQFKIETKENIRFDKIFSQLPYPKEESYDPLIGPDGMETIQIAGKEYLAVCQYGGGKIFILSQQGEIVTSVKIPSPYVTNLFFNKEKNKFYLTYTDGATGGAVMSIANPSLPQISDHDY